MLVLIHVIIAISSIIFTAFVFVRPSKSKLKVSYSLTAITLASGTYLVWSTGAPILQSCVTGLIYLAVIFVGILATHYKLAHTSQI